MAISHLVSGLVDANDEIMEGIPDSSEEEAGLKGSRDTAGGDSGGELKAEAETSCREPEEEELLHVKVSKGET